MSAIRAFEAAARLTSFTKAAEELHITQSAVSHSVRELEERLDVKLFIRRGRTLSLTEAGRLYLPFVTEALGRLRAGDHVMMDPKRKSGVLTVSVSPSFAAKWLVPRIGEFSAAHPDIDLRISANLQHVNFSDGEIDIAIRHGNGQWHDLHCTRLCEERLFPVCNPNLLREAPPESPDDLLRYTLIHYRTTETWKSWLHAFGVQATETVEHGPILNEMSLAIDAAIAGHGIALARSALVSHDLQEGRLIRPVRQHLPAPVAFWIVCPKPFAQTPKIIRVRDWLLKQASAGEESPA